MIQMTLRIFGLSNIWLLGTAPVTVPYNLHCSLELSYLCPVAVKICTRRKNIDSFCANWDARRSPGPGL